MIGGSEVAVRVMYFEEEERGRGKKGDEEGDRWKERDEEGGRKRRRRLTKALTIPP